MELYYYSQGELTVGGDIEWTEMNGLPNDAKLRELVEDCEYWGGDFLLKRQAILADNLDGCWFIMDEVNRYNAFNKFMAALYHGVNDIMYQITLEWFTKSDETDYNEDAYTLLGYKDYIIEWMNNYPKLKLFLATDGNDAEKSVINDVWEYLDDVAYGW